jgi:hypothetical protein
MRQAFVKSDRSSIPDPEFISNALSIYHDLSEINPNLCKDTPLVSDSDQLELTDSELYDLKFNHFTILLFVPVRKYHLPGSCIRKAAERNLDILAKLARKRRYAGQMTFHLYQVWLVFNVFEELGRPPSDVCEKIGMVGRSLQEAFFSKPVSTKGILRAK